jgi:hypothetical protein
MVLAGVALPAGAVDLQDLPFDLGSIFNSADRGLELNLAERILERELPKRVGPADRYEVRLDRKGTDLLRGRLGRADVTGIQVRTSDGLVIPRMELKLQDVRFNMLARSLDGVGKGDFSAALGQDVVTRFIRQRTGGAGVRDVSVAFRSGQIAVKGTPELLGFGMPSEMVGKPVLRGRDAVDFQASSVSVFGMKLPQFAVDTLERKINPVVDLSGLKLPVRITKFSIQGNRLVADGALDFSHAAANTRRSR